MKPEELTIKVDDLPGGNEKLEISNIVEGVYEYLTNKYSQEPVNFEVKLHCDGTVEVSKITWEN